MSRHTRLVFGVALTLLSASSHAQETGSRFRAANESAAQRRWDEALSTYEEIAGQGVRSPSLYWNWSQTAAATGRQGEALWALLNVRELSPGDSSVSAEVERLRAELGLDASEISLGLLGDLRNTARSFRLDAVALVALLVALALATSPRRARGSRILLAIGLALLVPFVGAILGESRAVVCLKDAPLVDIPRADAVPLAMLREGEVVPILGVEGDYLKIQDASGARGFAHKNTVRRLID